jgi:hypothetical protein
MVPAHRSGRLATTALCCLAAASSGGCLNLGPKSIPTDRFDYSTAVADSWKQQTLLNIVKLRYMDLPVFVEVASIVAGYSMETTGSAGAQFFSGNTNLGNNASVGVSGKFTDRPTITYVPLTGEKFLRGLMTPIEPKNIFFMLQSGYAADFILGLTVEALNGVRNRSTAGGVVREADPEFVRVVQLMRELQIAGAVAMRIEEDKSKGTTSVLVFRREGMPPEIAEKSAEARKLLKLSPDAQRFVLTYGPMNASDNELAVHSRSMLQIMAAFSSYMDVPDAHIADHSAMPGTGNGSGDDQRQRVRIKSGVDKPADAFAAVRYREHWYWIENGDWASKRALTAIMFFFTISESGSNDQLPLITIPAQ